MSTTAESPPEILIPSLPNDIALQCLARVPRRYHSVLSAVSKPIKSLLSSPEFFAARAYLNSTEILPYLTFRVPWRYSLPRAWFTVYRNGRTNDDKSNIVIAPVPGVSGDQLFFSDYATLGPKVYVVGDTIDDPSSTEMWIFDFRFHRWEQGPNMPTKMIRFPGNLITVDGKIYVIEWWPREELRTYVLDTVAGVWETLPSPKLRVFENPILGCGIRDGGKVCVWMEEEEARFDPETKTWEVFLSRIGSGLPPYTQLNVVNEVLYCLHSLENTPQVVELNENTSSSYVFKGFDESIGEWKMLKLVNNKGLPSQLSRFRMVNVGGRLIILGRGFFQYENILTLELAEKMGIWCAEIEVNKDENGDFSGEVLWSEMVYSTEGWFIDEERTVAMFISCTCMPISL